MKPLPERRYEYAEWEKHKVNIDYHVEVDHHYYSVPYQLRKEVVDARITATTVETPLQGQKGRVPSEELRSRQAHDRSCPHAGVPQALPGMDALPHREVGGEVGTLHRGARQGDHGEKAPPRAGLPLLPRHHAPGEGTTGRKDWRPPAKGRSFLKAYSYKSVESILKNKLDGKDLPRKGQPASVIHENIRGTTYYK